MQSHEDRAGGIRIARECGIVLTVLASSFSGFNRRLELAPATVRPLSLQQIFGGGSDRLTGSAGSLETPQPEDAVFGFGGFGFLEPPQSSCSLGGCCIGFWLGFRSRRHVAARFARCRRTERPHTAKREGRRGKSA